MTARRRPLAAVAIPCHNCRRGHYGPRGAGGFTCEACGHQADASAFPVRGGERLVVHAGALTVLTVPDGHEVISPTRRCHAPHLGASLALALRVHQVRPVFRDADQARQAAQLLADLDADGYGPWVLSAGQLAVLTRAMDVHGALLPSSSRRYPEFDAQVRAAYARSRQVSAR